MSEWDGRFGRGVIYADMETYFVANDAQDQEYLELGDRVRYYPRKGKNIGDLKDDVTIGKGKPWGGLGIRVEAADFNGIILKHAMQSFGSIILLIFQIMI